MTRFDSTQGSPKQPYVIAEIGVNHEGDFNTALKLIELAKEGGADAAKFQTYKAEKIASKHSPSYWDLKSEPTTSQYQLFKKYDRFGEEEYVRLAEHCKKVGIDFLSTPFDDQAIDFLNPLMKLYKIASADLTCVPMLRRVASKKKPVILSVGASTLEEVEASVGILKDAGAPQVTLLHCVLNYPTKNENANLGMITDLARKFPNHGIGYSDHTVPCPEMKVLMMAYAFGARVIEKHFTHDKTLPGNDHYHAMDARDLQNFRKRVSEYIEIFGSSEKKPLESEIISRQNARRSIVAQVSIRKGEKISEEMITYKRPGTGIPVRHWDEIVGSVAKKDIQPDDVFQWDFVK